MIWRVVVEQTPLVVVKADEDQKDRLSRCGSDLMQALGGLESRFRFGVLGFGGLGARSFRFGGVIQT